jgi:hypothetical protein
LISAPEVPNEIVAITATVRPADIDEGFMAAP